MWRARRVLFLLLALLLLDVGFVRGNDDAAAAAVAAGTISGLAHEEVVECNSPLSFSRAILPPEGRCTVRVEHPDTVTVGLLTFSTADRAAQASRTSRLRCHLLRSYAPVSNRHVPRRV